MKRSLFFGLFLLSAQAFCQVNCATATFTMQQQERRQVDTIWKTSYVGQAGYYVALQKDIIPKYWRMRDEALERLDAADVSKLNFLHRSYTGQIESYLDEMRATNRRAIQNLQPSSEINNVIIFETFRVFPDTWAMLVNPTVINRNVNNVDVIIINELYKKYSSKLQLLDECIRNFSAERKASMEANKAVLTFQGIDLKSKENSMKCDLIDILLWATL